MEDKVYIFKTCNKIKAGDGVGNFPWSTIFEDNDYCIMNNIYNSVV